MSTVLDRLHALAGWVRSRRWALGLSLAVPVVLMTALFIVTGFRGIDFGLHWDEVDWQIMPVRDMVANGLIMPRASIYPTLCKWLTLLPAWPAGLMAYRGTPRAVQAAMLAVIDRHDYLLIVRRLYVVVSALAIVWVYAAALVLRRKWWEALIAAACLGLSWEYAYHSRWVATDCILVQFSALELLLLALHHRTGRTGWLYAAAVAAGLATGTKYPGVVLLLPVVVAGALALPHDRGEPRFARVHLQRAATLCGVALLAYLVTTPSTLYDPFNFIEQYHWISRQYLQGHGGNTVRTSWEHLRIVFVYLAVAYFSPEKAISTVAFVVMLYGAYTWARADRRMAIVLLTFPPAFLAFFCFRFKDVIARNYLLMVPFLALLVGRGFGALFETLPRRLYRAVLAAALLAVMVLHASWLVRAGESIRHVADTTYVREAIQYIAKHPGTRFRISDKVRGYALHEGLKIPSNVTLGNDAEEVVFFVRSEGPLPWDWKCNDPWLTRAVFGPKEVNFVWYSGWIGHDRVAVMTRDKARSTGVALAK
jgi:hypothetical protein